MSNITPDELKRIFPGASQSTIRRNQAGGQGVGACAGSEEQHVQHRAKRKSRMEKTLRPQFRITVTLNFADWRIRDPDAALSTLLDCIIAARRQLANPDGNNYQMPESSTG